MRKSATKPLDAGNHFEKHYFCLHLHCLKENFALFTLSALIESASRGGGVGGFVSGPSNPHLICVRGVRVCVGVCVALTLALWGCNRSGILKNIAKGKLDLGTTTAAAATDSRRGMLALG